MAENPSHSDLGELVLEVFHAAGRRVGAIMQPAGIVEFFERSDLTRRQAQIGIDYALERGWIELEGIRSYRLVGMANRSAL